MTPRRSAEQELDPIVIHSNVPCSLFAIHPTALPPPCAVPCTRLRSSGCFSYMLQRPSFCLSAMVLHFLLKKDLHSLHLPKSVASPGHDRSTIPSTLYSYCRYHVRYSLDAACPVSPATQCEPRPSQPSPIAWPCFARLCPCTINSHFLQDNYNP
jgi:hypothetical protein